MLVIPYNILFQCMNQIISYHMYQDSVWEKENKFTLHFLQFMDLSSWALYFCMQEVLTRFCLKEFFVILDRICGYKLEYRIKITFHEFISFSLKFQY